MSKHTSLVIFMKSVLTHNFIIALGLKKIITLNNTSLVFVVTFVIILKSVCSAKMSAQMKQWVSLLNKQIKDK